MIRIEHISFEFVAPDETFAQGLYAGWDGFCRNCFERVVEECLATYDKERVLHEIGRLELDLGGIPEEEFYREFPLRLKEALRKALPPFGTHTPDEVEKSVISRRDNLLFFLKHGFPTLEWTDGDFNPSTEATWLLLQSSEIRQPFITAVARLCLEQEYALRRLLWQTDNVEMHLRVYTAALVETSTGIREKYRLLVLMLEAKPDIPVRFVHRAGSDEELQNMAALLDSPVVRCLMRTETREHAEVDLPPYWHYLYEWLIRYYPFNGLAVFGGKAEFTRHLHHRLLAFIRKRKDSPYLSKTELTLNFLLEVFGPVHYKEVLNAIYGLQPRNADGSPIYDGYLNRELYRIFMQLSLLELPGIEKEETTGKEETASLNMPADIRGLADILKENTRSDANKRALLTIMAGQQPERLLEWIREEVSKDGTLLSLLSKLTDDKLLNRLLALLSFDALETVEKVRRYLERQGRGTGRLQEMTEARQKFALHKATWTWIGNGDYALPEKESLYKLLSIVYREMPGNSEVSDIEIETIYKVIQSDASTWFTFRQMDKKELTAFLQDEDRSITDKRVLLLMVVREQPENLLDWLRSEASERETLLLLLSESADDRIISRLLASLSFTALETMERARKYLEQQSTGIARLREATKSQWQSALGRAVLRWIADGKADRPDAMTSLLYLIYQEMAGDSDDNTVVETWTEELKRMESLPHQSEGDETETASIYRLQRILSDTTLPDMVKQREAAAFWEAYREGYAKPIILLQAQQLLSDILKLTGKSVKEEIIRRQTMQAFGVEQATVLLPLFIGLVEHGSGLPSMQKTAAELLESGFFYWLAVQTQGRSVTVAEAIRGLFATLWDESEWPAVVKWITESMDTREEAYTPEAVLALLEEAGSNGKDIQLSAFHEWNRRQEMLSNTVQTAFKECWSTADDLAKWLEDGSMPTDYKRELLQTAITEHTQEWMALLRNTVQTEQSLETLTGYLSVPVLRQSMAKANFYQASVLSRVVERIEHHADTFPFLAANSVSLSAALSKALLRYMQDADTLERTLTEKEIIEKFLSVLYIIIYKGETGTDYRNDSGWKQLAAKVMPEAEQQETVEPVKQGVAAMLSDRELSGTTLQDVVQSLVESRPEKLLAWLEEDAGIEEIHRMAEVANIAILERWVEYLPTVAGFMNAGAFRRLAIWLLRSLSDKHSTAALATALFAWMKEPDWKQQTSRQIEEYFFARLHGGSGGDIPLPMESLARTDLPETIRQRLLQHFLRFRPKELLAYIRRSAAECSLPLARWTEWLDTEDWKSLAASLSLSAAELLRQVAEMLHLDEQAQRQTWSICLTTGNKEEEWAYNSPEENIRSFVQTMASVQEQGEAEVETIVRHIKEELYLREEEIPDMSEVPEFFPVGNAGLCLLSPWLVRLFGMLGYLDEEKKKLKDTASKIRAVFLLQYLVYGEEREYRETELSFNRLLAGLSRHVPLPKRLSLTEDEKRTIDSMMAGVKANWPKLKGTSVEGFRRSFIARNGTLEQQEERWLLTVEKKTHDILLDSVPWSFRQIRLPWLKKYIQVIWNEKQEFA